jgi:hypothetical protein
MEQIHDALMVLHRGEMNGRRIRVLGLGSKACKRQSQQGHETMKATHTEWIECKPAASQGNISYLRFAIALASAQAADVK